MLANTFTRDVAIEMLFKRVSEYVFRLRDLSTNITIRIYESLDEDVARDERFVFMQSHFLHTPVQMEPYMSNVTYGETEERALNRALRTLTQFYKDAVNAGHTPESTWLVRNPDFI